MCPLDLPTLAVNRYILILTPSRQLVEQVAKTYPLAHLAPVANKQVVVQVARTYPSAHPAQVVKLASKVQAKMSLSDHLALVASKRILTLTVSKDHLSKVLLRAVRMCPSVPLLVALPQTPALSNRIHSIVPPSIATRA